MLLLIVSMLVPNPGYADGIPSLNLSKLANGAMRLQASAAPGKVATVQASATLAPDSWVDLMSSLVPHNGVLTFDDNEAVAYRNRFYRLLSSDSLAPTTITGVEDGPLLFRLTSGVEVGTMGLNFVITSLPSEGSLYEVVNLPNGDFADGPNGWTAWIGQGSGSVDFRSTETPLNGTAPAARVQANSLSVAGFYRELQLVPGKRYYVHCLMRDLTQGYMLPTPELWIGSTAPIAGQDYGPGTTNAMLIKSDDSGKSGHFTATHTTMYLVARVYSLDAYARAVTFDNFVLAGVIDSVSFVVTDPTAQLFYVPPPNANGDPFTAFSYSVRNESSGIVTGTGTVQIKLTAVPDAPSVTVQVPTILEDTPTILRLIANDPDLNNEGDEIQLFISRSTLTGDLYQVASDNVTQGALINDGDPVTNTQGLVMYVPPPNVNGEPLTTFRFYAVDRYGLFSNEPAIPLSVLSVNDAPIARAKTHTGFNDVFISSVSLDITDPDGFEPFTVHFTRIDPKIRIFRNVPLTPANEITAGMYVENQTYFRVIKASETYESQAAWGTPFGTFSYYVSDGLANSAEVTDAVDILYRNYYPDPSASPTHVTVAEGGEVEIILRGNDPDGDNRQLTCQIEFLPAHGSLSLPLPSGYQITNAPFVLPPGPGAWKVIYRPPPNYSNTEANRDRFGFSLTDEQALRYPFTLGVELRVTPEPDAPVTESQVHPTPINTPLALVLFGSDLDNEPLTFQIVSNVLHGQLTGSSPNFTYTPNLDFNGTDQFTFVAVDPTGLRSPVATVTIYVGPICDWLRGSLANAWRGELDARDDAGGLHGIVHGEMVFAGNAYWNLFNFDGVNDWVELGGTPLADSWTVSMWVARNDSPDSSAILLADDATALKLEQHGSPNRNVGITEFGVYDYSFNYTAPAGEETHLVFVGTPSSTSLYVNGVLQDTLNLGFPLPRGQIGGRTSDRLAGTLDDLFVFERELTAAEIGRIFAAGSNPRCGEGGDQ